MTWICLSYILLSSLLTCGLSINNYGVPHIPVWSRRSGPFGDRLEPPQPAAGNYMPRDNTAYSEYSDDERASIPRSDALAGWAPQQAPQNTINNVKSPFSVVPEWPSTNIQLGQISAVCFDQDGNVVVFHRGDHVWNGETFLPNQVYNQKDLGPIETNTVIVFDSASGKVLHEWGANFFFMPHGLTVDKQSNVWVTDVALHQVFKFPPAGGSGEPLLGLGTRFEPGNDNTHFCKPSAVAVTASGDFFVSDGYCNHRIIKYSADGMKLLQWGRSVVYGMTSRPPPYAFAVPHALALAEDKDALCVADRENGRIQCFSILNGTFLSQVKLPEFGHRLFSVAYSPTQGGLLYAVNGPDLTPNVTVQGFVIGLSSQQLVTVFSPGTEGFSNPHDIAVSPDGKQIYVVQLDPHRVWKFIDRDAEGLSQFPDSRLKVVPSSGPTAAIAVVAPTPAVAINLPAKDALKSAPHSLLPTIGPAPHLLSLSMQVFIALAAILALTMVAVLFVFVRGKGPMCSCWICYKRWQFRRSPSEGFKLGSLLDPHSGFEQVCTEMSDEEEIDASTSSITTRRPPEPSVA